MTRKKVDLAYITCASKRKATFRKRRKGLLKKVAEITILCGIEACAIIFSRDELEDEPEVWPSEEGVQRMISKFRGVSELEQGKKMLCQASFLRQAIFKTKEKLKKVMKENRKKEMHLLMCQYFTVANNLENANLIDLKDITYLTDQNLEEIRKEINKRDQAQKVTVTPVTENEGEIMTEEGEEALVNYVKGTDTNAMQNWNQAADNDGKDDMLTLDDVNVPSGWLNQYIR